MGKKGKLTDFPRGGGKPCNFLNVTEKIKGGTSMTYKVLECWADGRDWIIKQTHDGRYFRRVANGIESWEVGLPNGVIEAEIEMQFRECEERT